MSLDSFGEDGPSVDAVTAALRADRSDLETFVQVLTTTLADALPAGMVSVERERSMSDRLAKRQGKAVRLAVRIGDSELILTSDRNGNLGGELCQQVRGVVISRRPVTIQEWTQLLAARLAETAKQNSSARDALAKLLGA